MEIKRETKVVEYIEFEGVRFYRDKRGYWLSSRMTNGKPKRLHIYVWEKHNGPVPYGYHVHHIDHNQDNNDIENLELVVATEHLKHHAKYQNKEWARKNLEEYARPKAIEWHKSEEGREWHKRQYERTKDSFHQRITITCLTCGVEVDVGKGGAGNKFCSNNCKSKHRRDIGIDNTLVNCQYCGKEFYTNKYAASKYCSKECRVMKRRENIKN